MYEVQKLRNWWISMEMNIHCIGSFFVAYTRTGTHKFYINRLANTTIQPTPYVPLCKRHTAKHINNINTLTCVTMHFVVIGCLSPVHTSIHFTSYYTFVVFTTDFALFLYANLVSFTDNSHRRQLSVSHFRRVSCSFYYSYMAKWTK